MCLMLWEAEQSSEVIAKQYAANAGVWQQICERLKQQPPQLFGTIARGSSDHAATFANYLAQIKLALPSTSINPSVYSVYHQALSLKQALVFGFSQSGQSADICQALKMARDQGAITVAIVNCEDSPMAEIAEFVVPVHAGEEKAVAATKSYLGMCAAVLQFVATYTQEPALLHSLPQLPELMAQAWQQDWSSLKEVLSFVDDALILGRGYGLAIANEAALKCKEVALMHAESFSSAEVMHGPLALVRENYPILLFAQQDDSFAGSLAVAKKLKAMEACVVLIVNDSQKRAASDCADIVLSVPSCPTPLFEPLLAMLAFYKVLPELAQARGVDPDKPRHLHKVTSTL